ncbi:MAG: hypothetical protein ACYT04_58755, partial [Nostoc sp.]
GYFAVDLLESGNGFQLQLLLAICRICHYVCYSIFLVDVLQKAIALSFPDRRDRLLLCSYSVMPQPCFCQYH